MQVNGYRNAYANLNLANEMRPSPLRRDAIAQTQPRIYAPDDNQFTPAERTTQLARHDVEKNGTTDARRTANGDPNADQVQNVDGTHVRDTDDGATHTREVWNDAGKHVRETSDADGKRTRNAWDDTDGKHVRDVR
ncbi:MAG TPA: hypothetical protein VGL08_22050, partial [Paraburkholderia sp.]